MRMENKDDLGLSLSLNVSENNHSHHHQSLQLNLMPSWLQSSSSSLNNNNHALQRTPWEETFIPSGPEMNTCRGEKPSFLKGIDVNRVPVTVDGEEDACLSSPNSTVSSISGKRSERETTIGDENDGENRNSDEEDGENSRKKLRLSKDQSAILEESFKEHNTLNPKQKMALAKQLGLRQRQVEVWFQNRRARTKLKQTEVDCEFLKRCCENLTEENRRLQKEVVELRALKLSPQFYMQMAPPTTLTMCPSCEQVGPSPGAASGRPTDYRAHLQAGSNISGPRPTFSWAGAPTSQRPFSSRP